MQTTQSWKIKRYFFLLIEGYLTTDYRNQNPSLSRKRETKELIS